MTSIHCAPGTSKPGGAGMAFGSAVVVVGAVVVVVVEVLVVALVLVLVDVACSPLEQATSATAKSAMAIGRRFP
jgi:hypothetical protein